MGNPSYSDLRRGEDIDASIASGAIGIRSETESVDLPSVEIRGQ